MVQSRGSPLRHAFQNWDALEALDNLTPPSPSPSLDDCGLNSYGSTGEIPILLHTGDDGSITDHDSEAPEVFYIRTPGSSFLDLTESYTSAETELALADQRSPSSSVPASPSPGSSPVASLSLFDSRHEASVDSIPGTVQGTLFNRNLGSTWTLSRTLFGSGSLLSPSPSALSVDSDSSSRFGDGSLRVHQRTKRSTSPLAGVFRSRSPSPHGPVASAPPSPNPGRTHGPISKPAEAAYVHKGAVPQTHVRSSPISGPLTLFPAQAPRIPGILDWLEELELEFWIDQEGSRTIWPTFKITGYSSEPTDDYAMDIVNALTYGSAEFKPIKLQSYSLQRGTLDTPLLLRRLTIAGDNAKDYISRQAYLPVNATGTFAVNGTELFGDQSSHTGHAAHHTHQPMLVRWRFEYKVDDCRADRRDVDHGGDKAFTPLAFSCSPALLHPTRGKKTKTYVWKKSKSSRLLAEKVENVGQRASGKENTADASRNRNRSLEHRRALSSGVLPDVRNMPEQRRITERPVSTMTVPS